MNNPASDIKLQPEESQPPNILHITNVPHRISSAVICNALLQSGYIRSIEKIKRTRRQNSPTHICYDHFVFIHEWNHANENTEVFISEVCSLNGKIYNHPISRNIVLHIRAYHNNLSASQPLLHLS